MAVAFTAVVGLLQRFVLVLPPHRCRAYREHGTLQPLPSLHEIGKRFVSSNVRSYNTHASTQSSNHARRAHTYDTHTQTHTLCSPSMLIRACVLHSQRFLSPNSRSCRPIPVCFSSVGHGFLTRE